MALSFQIEVDYKGIMYPVDVIRTSPGIEPTNYFATIVVSDNISNKFPLVAYTTEGGRLLFNDSLELILPGFAELQKNEIIKYLKLHNIEL